MVGFASFSGIAFLYYFHYLHLIMILLSKISWYLQMVFSALAFSQSEVLWYFQHVGVTSSKSKAGRMAPVEIVRKLVFFCPLVLSRITV